jgi:hypothetical protein
MNDYQKEQIDTLEAVRSHLALMGEAGRGRLLRVKRRAGLAFS